MKTKRRRQHDYDQATGGTFLSGYIEWTKIDKKIASKKENTPALQTIFSSLKNYF